MVVHGSNNSKHWRKRVLRIRLQSHQVHPTVLRAYNTYAVWQDNTKSTNKHKWIYAQWNGPSETKPNPENCKNCSSKCAYDCAQLQYTIQHRTVLIISPVTSRQPEGAHSKDVGKNPKEWKHWWWSNGLSTDNRLQLISCNTILLRTLIAMLD